MNDTSSPPRCEICGEGHLHKEKRIQRQILKESQRIGYKLNNLSHTEAHITVTTQMSNAPATYLRSNAEQIVESHEHRAKQLSSSSQSIDISDAPAFVRLDMKRSSLESPVERPK